MAITQRTPNKVFLGGERTQVNDFAAHLAITPGMAIESYVPSTGINRFRPATDTLPGLTVADDQSMLNKGVDDAYGVGDLVQAFIPHKGAVIWGLIPSGENIAFGDELEKNAAVPGYFRALASGSAVVRAIETSAPSAAARRIKLEVL